MADAIHELSQGLAQLVKRSGPSVVRIEGRRRGPSSGIVWSPNVLITASHVLEWDEVIKVGLPDGATTNANVAGRDPGTDLAVLRVDASGLNVPEWTDAEGLETGHLVLGLSRPGSQARANLGIVSGRGEKWWTPAGGRLDDDIRLDIGLHPGFSGSLLVDTRGRALGLNTAGILRATPILVPTTTVRRVVDDIVAHGHVRRGFLGIGTQGVRLPAAAAQAVGQPAALLITNVQPDSAAATAGLMLGDVLVGFAGEAVRHPAELYPLLDASRIGQTVTLKVLRAGRLEDVSVTVRARENERNAGGERP
jgi:S1-C subfamily serine protease